LHLLRFRMSKFSSKLGNPTSLRSKRPRKNRETVLGLTYPAIGLGNLVLVGPSEQKRLVLPHGRGMSLSRSRILGTQHALSGLLVPKLAILVINFTFYHGKHLSLLRRMLFPRGT